MAAAGGGVVTKVFKVFSQDGELKVPQSMGRRRRRRRRRRSRRHPTQPDRVRGLTSLVGPPSSSVVLFRREEEEKEEEEEAEEADKDDVHGFYVFGFQAHIVEEYMSLSAAILDVSSVSLFWLVGFTGDDAPRVMFPSGVAKPRMLCILSGMDQKDRCNGMY